MKLAVCIPTFNRADVVEELLQRTYKQYAMRGWDIIIYDSSDNDDTYKIVERFGSVNHLKYKRIDSAIHSNLKVYGIFEEMETTKEYDYLWVCSDSISWSDSALELIDDALEDDYDLIIPNYRDVEHIGTHLYSDKTEFFKNCAWHMTLYGATIVNCKTILNGNNWNRYKEKYCIPSRINHSHVAFYFEKIDELNEFRALHIDVGKGSLKASPLKVESGWRRDIFYVWVQCWPNMIYSLPQSYDPYKDYVIRQSGTNSEMFNVYGFLDLRRDRIISVLDFWKYRHVWNRVCDVPAYVIFAISIIPAKLVWIFDNKRFRRKRKRERQIKKFCMNHKKIYIYGCGLAAKGVSAYMKEIGYEPIKYIVSCGESEKDMFLGKEVVQYDAEIFRDFDCGIILALNMSNAEEVLKTMGDINSRNVLTLAKW